MKGWEKTYLDNSFGTSLAVQWLRLQDSGADDVGLIHAQELRSHVHWDMAFPHFIHLD